MDRETASWKLNVPKSYFEDAVENNDALSVVPNPFTNNATLHVNLPYSYNHTKFDVYVYNSMGKIVRKIENNTYSTTIINRNGLSSGVYIIKAITEFGDSYTCSMVID